MPSGQWLNPIEKVFTKKIEVKRKTKFTFRFYSF